MFFFLSLKSQEYKDLKYPKLKLQFDVERIYALSNGEILIHQTNEFKTRHKFSKLDESYNVKVTSDEYRTISETKKVLFPHMTLIVPKEPSIQLKEFGDYVFLIYKDGQDKGSVKCSILFRDNLKVKNTFKLCDLLGTKREVAIFCEINNGVLGVYVQNKTEQDCLNYVFLIGEDGGLIKESSFVENHLFFQPYKNQILLSSKGEFYKLVRKENSRKNRELVLVSLLDRKVTVLNREKDFYRVSIAENPFSKKIVLAGFKSLNELNNRDWDIWFEKHYCNPMSTLTNLEVEVGGILLSEFDIETSKQGEWVYSENKGVTPQSFFRDFHFIDENSFLVVQCNGFFKHAYEGFSLTRGSINCVRFDNLKMSWVSKVDGEQFLYNIPEYSTGSLEHRVVGFKVLYKNDNAFFLYNNIVKELNSVGRGEFPGRVVNEGDAQNNKPNYLSTYKKNCELKLAKINFIDGSISQKSIINYEKKNGLTVPALGTETPNGELIIQRMLGRYSKPGGFVSVKIE